MQIEQSAIEWLYEKMVRDDVSFFDLATAMKMHREEIEKAYDEGWGDGRILRMRDGKEFYNETYGEKTNGHPLDY